MSLLLRGVSVKTLVLYLPLVDGSCRVNYKLIWGRSDIRRAREPVKKTNMTKLSISEPRVYGYVRVTCGILTHLACVAFTALTAVVSRPGSSKY